jgi:hypothetical protein
VAGGDPLSVVGARRPGAGRGRLLVITGGKDEILYPLLATRLADAYRLRPVGGHRRRGGRVTLVQWPELGHDLATREGVREQAYAFLATGGRPAAVPEGAP